MLTPPETPAVPEQVSILSIIIFEKMCFKLSKMLSTFAIKFFYKIVQNHQIA